MKTTLTLFCCLFLYFVSHAQSFKGEELEYMQQMGSRTAKQTWWFFDKRLKEPLESYKYSHVFIEFQHVYIKDIKQLPSGKYQGLVDLELPHDPSFDESNQEIKFDSTEIDDWFIVADTYLLGGFQIRLLPFPEQQLIKRKGHFNISVYAINDDFIESSQITRRWSSNSDVNFSDIFPGGTKTFMDSLHAKIEYPDYAKLMGIEGDVTINFTVSNKGGISKVKIIRGIGGGVNDIARSVLFDLSKYFIPFESLSIYEEVVFTLPFRFSFRSY